MLTWYVVYWSVLYLILDSARIWYSLLLELTIPTLAWHWDLYRVVDTDQFILSKWWEPTAGSSWRRVWVSWKYLMGRIYQTFEIWDIEMHWYCEDNDYLFILFVWEFVWWDVTVLWGQYLHHRHRDLQIRHLILIMTFIASENVVVLQQLWPSLTRTTLPFRDFDLHYGSAITVVERLQRYNCIWLTYIENVEQNVLLLHWGLKLWDAISMWKADLEMGRGVSTTFFIQKKVVQNTLCEPLRSWEANAYMSVTC